MNKSKIKSIPLKLKEVDYGNEDLFEEYFKLINDAYFLELGNTGKNFFFYFCLKLKKNNLYFFNRLSFKGVAFKTKNRFTSKEIAKQTWKDTIVLRAFLENDNEEDGKEKKQDFEINSTKTIGFASFWPVKEDKLCIDLGPFAIDPKLKGKGYGTVFLNKIKDYCRNVLKKETLLIVVVNLRTG